MFNKLQTNINNCVCFFERWMKNLIILVLYGIIINNIIKGSVCPKRDNPSKNGLTIWANAFYIFLHLVPPVYYTGARCI